MNTRVCLNVEMNEWINSKSTRIVALQFVAAKGKICVEEFRVFTRKTMNHRVFRFDYCTQEITLIRCLAWNVQVIIIERHFACKESTGALRKHHWSSWMTCIIFRLTSQSDWMLLDKYWLDNFDNMSYNRSRIS